MERKKEIKSGGAERPEWATTNFWVSVATDNFWPYVAIGFGLGRAFLGRNRVRLCRDRVGPGQGKVCHDRASLCHDRVGQGKRKYVAT